MFEINSSKKIFHANDLEARKVIFKDRIANSYPYVVRSTINNGIRAYVLENKEFLNPANTLSLAQDTFSVFYQEEPYFTGNKVKVLTPKKFKLNKIRGLFIMAICQKSLADFTWGKNSDVAELESFILTLPTDSKGNLAFDFMESYIAELEAERVRELEAYLRATGLSNYTLTKKEELALNIISDTNRGGGKRDNPSSSLEALDSIIWKQFRIGDLFEMFTGRDVIIGRTELGNIPLVSHQNTDNGVVKYIKKLNDRHIFDYRYTISLADRGVFYASTQFENFHIGTRVKALVFKDKNKISKEIRLFFVSTINKLQTLFKDYLINATNKLPDLKITLPTDSKGNLAFDFMESSIKAIQKEVIRSVVLYVDTKINATKEAVKKH